MNKIFFYPMVLAFMFLFLVFINTLVFLDKSVILLLDVCFSVMFFITLAVFAIKL
jgi:hypothetical protein